MRSFQKKTRGSLVLVALCFTAVIGIALASYIAVCYQSLNLSTREYRSKQARHLAEVGLEEALWALNNATWTTSGPSSASSWSGTTTKTLTLSGYPLGSGATGQIALTITNATGSTPSLASIATITLGNGQTYRKTLSATTQRAPQFGNAIASAAGAVTFSSAGTIDSFDSTSAYSTSTNRTYAAVVAGDNVSITNADVRGYLETYGNSPTYSSGTVIGLGGSGVDLNRLGKSAFIPIFTVTTPSPGTWNGSLSSASSGTVTLGTAGGATEYYHCVGSYSLTGGNLTINGPVKIVVTGSFTLSGTSRIRLATTTAALEMFVTGSVSVTSSTAFQNRNPSTAAPVPSNMALYVTGSGSTVTWNSAARFDGVLYATHANAGTITIANTGLTPAFYGAILSNNAITFSGAAPYFHYDTDLRTVTFPSITTPFIINALTESSSER